MDTAQADDQLLMSTDPDSTLGEDEDIEVVLDRSKLHLFDGVTGEAITHGLAPSTDTSSPETGVSSSD